MPKQKILVVEDEVQIRRLLRLSFETEGYDVVEAETGADGLVQAANIRPAAVVLDLGLPDISGFEVLKRLREWTEVPVVILSVQDDEQGKVEALDHGADDYVTKPFGIPELLARVRVALRHKQRLGATDETAFKAGDLEVDLAKRIVKLAGQEVHMTSIEYDLLRLFVRNAGKVLTHRQILKEIWGPQNETQTHYLRVYIASLRKKVETDPSSPKWILTESGIGYRFKEPTR